MQLPPFTPQVPTLRQPPRFGAGGPAELKGITRGFNEVFKRITHDRTTEMLLEDFVGFGVLRTWMDLRRGKTYGDNQNNLPAATERLSRETLSILTDNVLAGGVAYGIAKWLDKNKQGFSNEFIDFDTLDLFHDVVEKMPKQAFSNTEEAKKAFLKELQGRFGVPLPSKTVELLDKAWERGKVAPDTKKRTLAEGFKNWWAGKQDNAVLKNGTEFVQALNPEASSYSRKLTSKGGQQVSLRMDQFLDDITRFSRHMQGACPPHEAANWASKAAETIQRTLKTKSTRIPIAIGAAMAATFAVPFVISAATRKYWGINYYPGEIGLRKHPAADRNNQPEAKKSFAERHFPYITQTLKNGNVGPFAVSLLPLFFAMGLFNTVSREFVKPGAGFFKRLLRSFDFQKAKPFTAQQQMASVFALLITSRLWNARSDNEFRERMVDSFLGWGLWILGTPLIKKALAKMSDASQNGTVLLDEAGGLRSPQEIKSLLREGMVVNGKKLSQEMLDKTYHRSVWLGIGSTIATMLLLGIVEPWIGIRWTQANEKKKQAAEAAKARQSFPIFPPQGPFAGPVQSFGAYANRMGQVPRAGYGTLTLPQQSRQSYASLYNQPQWPAQPQQFKNISPFMLPRRY